MGTNAILVGILLIPAGILFVIIYFIWKISSLIGGKIVKQILLVDDAVDFLKILAQALEQDFEVYTATGVSEAMSLVEKLDMDLICSDLEMKDGTGLDILTSLKKNIWTFRLFSCLERIAALKLKWRNIMVLFSYQKHLMIF